MLKIDWYPLRERYNLPLNGDLIPVEQINRITGWTVTVNDQGYFWATNHDFGNVEGTLQSSVTATHAYVLSDFMNTVKFVPLAVTQHISHSDTITPDSTSQASTGLVSVPETMPQSIVEETTVWNSGPLLNLEDPILSEEIEVIYTPYPVLSIDDPLDEVEDKTIEEPLTKVLDSPQVITPSTVTKSNTRSNNRRH